MSHKPRGEKRKNAQSQRTSERESTGSNWITFTTTGGRKVHSTHSCARISTEAEKQVSKMLVVTLWITGGNHLPDKAFYWGWRYSWAQTARAVLCSSHFHMTLIKTKKGTTKAYYIYVTQLLNVKKGWFPRNVWMTLLKCHIYILSKRNVITGRCRVSYNRLYVRLK